MTEETFASKYTSSASMTIEDGDESEWEDEHENMVGSAKKTMKLTIKDKYVKCSLNCFAY